MTVPVKQSHMLSRASRLSGSFRGAMRDWNPRKNLLTFSESKERELTDVRIEDLFRNDGVTRSVINSLTTNVVGKGLTPQSVLPYAKLGLTAEQAKDIQEEIEWLWFEWAANAHYRDQFTFDTLQSMAVRSLVRSGEFVHLPIMEKHPRPGCRFRLRIQDIDPRRLRNPIGKTMDPYFHDGVEVDATGLPVAYWILSPSPQIGYVDLLTLNESDYVRYPARLRLGRKGIFHVFKAEEEEQYRGVSALAPVISFLKNFTDSIDNELLAQVISSSFAIFIGLENPTSDLPSFIKEDEFQPPVPPEHDEKHMFQDIQGGQIMYGQPGEKPQVLENARPSANFQNFCTLLLRMIGASLELPYETVTKDFSKTTYSSARAALLEAYRVYDIYRNNLVSQYCQPIYSMVLEEAFLSGFIDLPCTVQDFYKNKILWTNAQWVAPGRGYIDPEKEANANIALLEAGLISRSEIIAERGGDFDEVVQRLADEDAMIKKLRPDIGLTPQSTQMEKSKPIDDEKTQENDDSSQNIEENEQENGTQARNKNHDER